MSKRYKVIEIKGVTFFFKWDPQAPELLHIYVRHLTTIDQALAVFFEGDTQRNERHDRYESQTQTHGLYWFWLDEKAKKVMIITCFKRGEASYES